MLLHGSCFKRRHLDQPRGDPSPVGVKLHDRVEERLPHLRPKLRLLAGGPKIRVRNGLHCITRSSFLLGVESVPVTAQRISLGKLAWSQLELK